MEEDIPFGPPPNYYNYRCSNCKNNCKINEAIVDAAVGWAKFDGRYCQGVMPDLECPNCGKETLKYVAN